MKKLLLLVAGIVTLASCSKSPEKKADALIKKELNKVLYHAETYDPVETVLDSAFYPLDSPVLYELIDQANAASIEYNEQEQKAKSAKSSMALWDTPYQSAYGRNRYNEYKDTFEKASEQAEKLKNKMDQFYQKICSMLNEKPKFVGYKALHSFRAQNNVGDVAFGHDFFLMDEKLEKVTYSCEAEKYNEYQEAIKLVFESMNQTNGAE